MHYDLDLEGHYEGHYDLDVDIEGQGNILFLMIGYVSLHIKINYL